MITCRQCKREVPNGIDLAKYICPCKQERLACPTAPAGGFLVYFCHIPHPKAPWVNVGLARVEEYVSLN